MNQKSSPQAILLRVQRNLRNARFYWRESSPKIRYFLQNPHKSLPTLLVSTAAVYDRGRLLSASAELASRETKEGQTQHPRVSTLNPSLRAIPMKKDQMLPTTDACLYDYPKYYDLVYGSDWKAEFDFLLACFARHAQGRVKRVFEPACGTGRLLVRLAQAGLQVAGVDLNAQAIDYCNERLARFGFPRSAVVGDMCDFQVRRQYDAAFNPINSFRHLATQTLAEQHLHTVARGLRSGGIYVLGLHLTPDTVEPMQQESWSARRGNLAVLSRLWVVKCDRLRRREEVGMSFDVYTPTRQFRIEDRVVFRTYNERQMRSLLAKVPEFELTQVYDFGYDIDAPIVIGPETEDVVYVLRKK